ncbi:MAG: LysR family transcriptional regulator [Aestuariivirga sp.]
MDRFNELRVFVAVADCAGLAKAAKLIHSSPPAVTRTLSALEERLGVRLFDRTTRSLRLTGPGVKFLDDARRVLADLEHAEQEVAGQSKVVSGNLMMTASLTFGRLVLQPIVLDFLAANPRINVSLLLFDRVVDLVDEGFDLAVRIADLPDSTLVSRHVGDVRPILVASPAYLARHGAPRTPNDLRLHMIIAQTALMPNREWRFSRDGKPARITLPARLEINDAHACIHAAERGDGITIALSYMVAEAVRDGRLAPVLQEFSPRPVPVNLIFAQRRIIAPKVRAFIDFAAPRLAAALSGADLG